MRFLLHATKRAKKRLGTSSSSSPLKSAVSITNKSTNNNTTTTEAGVAVTKSWGQQCSPHCGCIVRFESILNDNNVVVSASYHTKQILTTTTTTTIHNDDDSKSNNGRPSNRRVVRRVIRQPHYTSSNNNNRQKPLLSSCSCTTLDVLCNRVTQFLEGRRWDHVQNAYLTGAGASSSGGCSRSSAAVRHTILQTHGLPLSHSTCLLLVQQALVAMVCGYLPNNKNEQTQEMTGKNAPAPPTYAHVLSETLLQEHDDDETTPTTAGSSPHDATAAESSTLSLFSYYDSVVDKEEEEESAHVDDTGVRIPIGTTAMDMFDMNIHQDEEQSQQEEEEEQEQKQMNERYGSDAHIPILTWQDYVDELLHRSSDDNEQRQTY